jgi:hypothetical protein
MSGGGYGQQQGSPWGAQSGGNMYRPDGFGGGKGYSLTGSQPWLNQPTTNPVSQPSPMDQAFAPTQGMGGPMPWSGDPAAMGQTNGQITGTGQFGGTMGQPLGMDAGQAGGNMGAQWNYAGRRTDQGSGGVNPLAGMATTNPVGGGGYGPDGFGGGPGYSLTGGSQSGGSGLLGSRSQPGSYQDYMNRRQAWSDQLRGYVSPPPQPTWGGQPGPGQPPVTSVPPGGPAPKQGVGPKQSGASSWAPEQYNNNGATMQQFDQLFKEDPRLAYQLMLRNGPQPWNQNKSAIQQKYFGGDANAYNNFVNTSGSRPLSNQERWRLNDMIGLPSPDRMG